MTKSGTTSFLVIQDDTLVFERYGNGYNHDSIVTSFSVAKSFASALVGFAIDDGYISSVNDPITKYIPELIIRDKRFGEITIKHLLTMTSGISYYQDAAPWDDGMKTYFAPDMRKSALSVQIEQHPGESFLYNNYNPLLLGLILERTTGKSVTEYLEEKIWRSLGMEVPGSWTLDSEKSGFEKMQVGVNGRAIDFAKFGRLYLNYGNWNGKQLLSSDWVKSSTEINNTPSLLQDMWVKDYKYAWWVNEKWYAAVGAQGQYICVSPEKNTIIVRFGIEDDRDNWVKFFDDIIDSVRK